MAVDIVPELTEKIWQEFDEKVASSKKIKAFNKKLNEETATAADVSEYAEELGNLAGAVLSNNLKEDELPNGRIYYNIAERTIKPIIEKIYNMVMDAAKRQQEADNEKTGIRIKAVNSDFPEDKIKDLMFKFAEIFEVAEDEQSI